MVAHGAVKVERMSLQGSGRVTPNHFIIHTADGAYFQSYDTVIVFVSNTGDVELDKQWWEYSRTTSKYRNQFLGETTEETRQHIKDGHYKLVDLN